MRFYSTNEQIEPVGFREAALKGLPEDNGLYLPISIPQFTGHFLRHISEMSYAEIAFESARLLLEGEIPDSELESMVHAAFNFEVAVRNIHDNIHVLELFHGPTLAFKDFGARFMALAMGWFLRNEDQEINILVATSGDTGSAVAQGFLGVEGVRVTLLYPSGRVSEVQEKQLTTIGQNITALEVDGTFDDCQKLVKQAFLDKELSKRCNLSSANSINIARLLPQSFYYTYAYSRLAKSNKKLVFSVPSGNFGNLSAGILAKRMGVPIGRFVAACNSNDIVPKYLATAHFDPRPSKRTISNAMDVGNPSNFVRMLHLYEGSYDRMAAEIDGISFTDEETRRLIKQVNDRYNYLMCPHTAIGYGGLKQFLNQEETGVFLSTAHPAKFMDIVNNLVDGEVEVPARLQKILDRHKVAIPISAEYSAFSEYLLGS
jgi:threonine synthase